VSFLELKEGVGEVDNVLMAVDVGHNGEGFEERSERRRYDEGVSVEREVQLLDVSHYPATAYSEPMIRWRLSAAADVRRGLFSSPSVDRPMCAKQHHT